MAFFLIISMLQLSLAGAGEMPSNGSDAACSNDNGHNPLSKALNTTSSKLLKAAAANSAPRVLRLPKLITQGFITRDQVCVDARINHPDKKLLLVAVKTHVCDTDAKVCLRATRDLSDPCNRFIHSNFAEYHTRRFRTSPDRKHDFEEDPASEEIGKIWGNAGPTLVVVDVASCTKLGQVGPGLDGISGNLNLSAPERFRMMQNQLLGVPGLRDKLSPGAAAPLSKKELRCFQKGAEPTLDQTWQALENAQP